MGGGRVAFPPIQDSNIRYRLSVDRYCRVVVDACKLC